MKFLIFSMFLLSAVLVVASDSIKSNTTSSQYLLSLEQQNKISYNEITNTAGSYIPSMCYTKTVFDNGSQHNPCYACHIKGNVPNYINTSRLQIELDFPPDMRINPYDNLFKNRFDQAVKISDQEILSYVRKSNYQNNGELILDNNLPKDWLGYRPDAFYQFDQDGFDRKPNGGFTLWRAYRYYPFVGTFWPTNGSTDDVMIRLSPEFTEDENKKFDLAIYKINLAIVESLIKGEDVQFGNLIDEKIYGEDLNQNGKLDISGNIVFPPKHYVGHAKLLQRQNKIHLAAGLFPVGTEFLHSVRYLDWDNKTNKLKLSARMKELRYAKKYQWFNYSELKDIAQKEFLGTQFLKDSDWKLETFRGSALHGLRTASGWVLQGFIEDNGGQLRPQTREETIYCMGCHSGTGATVDAIFSFSRKFSEESIQDSWRHWSQKGLVGVKEAKASYQNHTDVFEYDFYLLNNPTGNEFASNSEVIEKFFDDDGKAKQEQFKRLRQDISLLLHPSFERAMRLNKGYKMIVEDQSYIYGREGNILPFENVHKKVKDLQLTGLNTVISR